jgi:hypothetical protein
MDRRRFLAGTALLGLGAALGPAGLVAIRRTARPGAPDLAHTGQVPHTRTHTHAPHPILPAPVYVTVVETHYTPAGVPYLAAVARPA